MAKKRLKKKKDKNIKIKKKEKAVKVKTKKIKAAKKIKRKQVKKEKRRVKIKKLLQKPLRKVKTKKIKAAKKIKKLHKPHPVEPGVLESYTIEIDKAKVKIEIRKEKSGAEYHLSIPEIPSATKALMDQVRQEIISITTINIIEIVDEKTVEEVKKRFIKEAKEILRDKIPNIKPELEELLIGLLIQEMLGLGKIEFLINDPNLEEVVVISSKEPIRIYHKKYGWLPTNLIIATEDEILNYSNIIARRIGKQITILSPLLDAHVVTGDRANAVLYPISTKGNTITIRKFSRDPWTIISLIENNTCTLDIAALLWLGIEYEMNVLVSGGTASGKTVFLNALMPFIPPNHRIISIEDTRELMLPEFLYWCPLATRTPNQEGKGEVSMLDLLVNSLRMRPDRIILGEMRRQREAEVLFEAMHTGHSVYATVHADTAAETISRLVNPPLNVPFNLLKAVNLNTVMFRDRKRGIRRILQLAEIMVEKDSATPNIIYRWIPEKDSIEKHAESIRFFEDLSRHTGMSQTEIFNQLKKRKEILEWMLKNQVKRIDQVGKIMNLYYTDKEKLYELIKKNPKPETILSL